MYECECLRCNYKMNSDSHCQDIRCPKCGGPIILLYALYAIGYNGFYWLTNQKVPEQGMYVIRVYKLDYLERKIDLNPSMSELKRFLRKNKIDEREYDKREYNCVDFSEDFVEDFQNEGYFSCTAVLYYLNNKTTHEIVTVRTERGIVFVEPQTDKVYNLDIGDDYGDKTISKIESCFEKKELLSSN